MQLDTFHLVLISVISVLVTIIMKSNILMKPKSTLPPANLIPPSQFLDFLLIIGKLKQEKRTGWINHDIPFPESIADHMYRMAIMALFIRDGSVDPYKASQVALVHDAAEALVGDITPPDSSGISVEEKHMMEKQAFNHISATLINPLFSCDTNSLALEFEDLYNQYNDQTTDEGKLCKQLDKLEMIIQALEYETLNDDKDLETFYNSGKKGIKHPYLLLLQDEVHKRRRLLFEQRAVAQK